MFVSELRGKISIIRYWICRFPSIKRPKYPAEKKKPYSYVLLIFLLNWAPEVVDLGRDKILDSSHGYFAPLNSPLCLVLSLVFFSVFCKFSYIHGVDHVIAHWCSLFLSSLFRDTADKIPSVFIGFCWLRYLLSWGGTKSTIYCRLPSPWLVWIIRKKVDFSRTADFLGLN